MEYAANQPIQSVNANEPFLYRASDSIPGAAVGLSFNTGRGSNTILNGVHSKPWRNTRSIRSSIANHRPRYWNRMGSYDAFYDDAGGTYSPFQVLARAGNWAANKPQLFGGSKFTGKYAKYAGAENLRTSKGGASIFGAGTAARFAAISRIGAGAGAGGLGKFLGHSAGAVGAPNVPGMSALVGGMTGGMSPASFIAGQGTITSKGASIAMTSQGAFSRTALGYSAVAAGGTEAATAGRVAALGYGSVAKGMNAASDDLLKAGLRVSGGSLHTVPMSGLAAPRGSTLAATKIGNVRAFTGAFASGNKAGMRVAGTRIGGAVASKAGPIGWAMLAYDLAKLGGEVFKSAVSFTGDATKSFQGSIHKPIFGMGYKDTQFAATSRARGVMAIQNSRLNARSMLGSEAGMMAAHFG
jgi:hypothetical protein